MVRRTRTARAGAALAISVAFAATAAVAADVAEPPYPDGAAFAAAAGWYARADVGYRLMRAGTAAAPDPVSPGRVEDVAAIGAGFGYKAGRFRADVTVDYGFAAYYAATPAPAGALAARIDSVAVLVNGYLDLGTWGGITPYVGAGVGGAMPTTSGLSYLPTFPSGTVATNSKWNLAWAVTGGVGVALAHDLSLDVGYRYLSLGDAQSGALGTGGPKVMIGDLAAHELRVGLRWTPAPRPSPQRDHAASRRAG